MRRVSPFVCEGVGVLKTGTKIFLSAAGLTSAAAFLFGYTLWQAPVTRKGGKLHLACVGDSVTYGCALPLFFLRRYPAVLQRLLGSEVQVVPFAVNDRTLQNSGNKPFRRERSYRKSLEFQPQTVVILLGTNDSKACNWISAEAFRREYASLIAAYRALPTKPRILICTLPCAFRPPRILSFITTDAMVERIPEIAAEIRAIAAAEGVELVDLYALTEGRRELFGPDGLHPSPAGARRIAEEVRAALQHETREPGRP